MKALVVYDSFYGNTEQIARAIGEGLGSQDDVPVLRVGDVGPEQLTAVTLLVVGSPTRAFRPTPAITKLLRAIPRNGLEGAKVAAFDTRIAAAAVKSSALRFIVDLGGYAAKPIANRLRKKGADLIVPPEGFVVADTEGPLKEGEIERAAAWGRQIAETITGG